jgi:prophage DNA circulation protein
MGWKERFRQGSFRGVPFYIDAADSDFGRRLVTHEFPQQEKPFIEDLGRKARKFVVECYVLGNEYLAARDLLLLALEKKGPGPLVHPYFGRIEANVEGVKVRDSSTETRIARFQITFVESGETVLPAVTSDTVAVVKAAALSSKDRVKAAFAKVYDFAGLPYAQTQSVLVALQSASDAIRDAQGAVNKISDFAKDLQDIGGALSQLALDAELLADSFMNLIGFGFLDEDSPRPCPHLREAPTHSCK